MPTCSPQHVFTPTPCPASCALLWRLSISSSLSHALSTPTHLLAVSRQGYQSIRMIPRESQKTPGKNLHLCFVEFDNAHQAMHCMNQLQGYRVDKSVEGAGIRISFSKARSERRSSTGAPGSAPRPPPSRPTSGSGAARYPQEEMQDYDGPSGRSEAAHGDYLPQDYDDEHKGDRRRDGREHRRAPTAHWNCTLELHTGTALLNCALELHTCWTKRAYPLH